MIRRLNGQQGLLKGFAYGFRVPTDNRCYTCSTDDSPLVARTRLLRIPIWSFMAFASFISVLAGLVSWGELGVIIDLNVILFLIGMFSIVGLAEASGLLKYISYAFISRFKSRYGLILCCSILYGLLATFTVNDTVAITGPSIAYTVSRVAGLPISFSFILLALSLTIGSAMTPIGNPQNMLIRH
ncbi:MAG: SLC13 family permease [Thermosphaera aggregans]|jgi:Na+/H+ antiporter NhaD/arsenite permease-like protein|uniref:SLC13 family permease n=1 Tax=Thermosphaera aggregans TaxID=54254 RepID=UPI003C1099FD